MPKLTDECIYKRYTFFVEKGQMLRELIANVDKKMMGCIVWFPGDVKEIKENEKEANKLLRERSLLLDDLLKTKDKIVKLENDERCIRYRKKVKK